MTTIQYIVKYLAYILIIFVYGYYTYREGYKQANKEFAEWLYKKSREGTEK